VRDAVVRFIFEVGDESDDKACAKDAVDCGGIDVFGEIIDGYGNFLCCFQVVM
jgi:hypothetical protein